MKVYRYWEKVSEPVQRGNRSWQLECYGASNTSVEEALKRASQRAKAAAKAIEQGSPLTRYSYGERPLREEIVKEFEYEGHVAAILTRNSYGSLVINTSNVLFADIDLQPPSFFAKLRDGLSQLLGRPRPTQDQQIVDRVDGIARKHPDVGIRLYRTRNGFRGLVTSRTFDPTADGTSRFLTEFGTDPLYTTLCRTHECFRARLSPKHWRCGLPRPPARYPWATAEAERAYRDWQRAYEAETAGYATCAFVGTFGSSHVHPAAEPVVTIHDRLACSGDGPLA